VSRPWGENPGPPSRTARSDAALRRRRLIAIGAVLVILVVGFAGLQLSDNSGGGAAPPVTTSSPPAQTGPATLTAFSVTGAPRALLAVVGSGGAKAPAALVLPSGMTIIVPGQGETTTENVQALPGESMRVGVSNAVGSWADHYAVTDLRRFGKIIDGAGGLTVDLADAYPVGGTVLGPGRTKMTGDQVVAFLSQRANDTDLRWSSVLQAFLAAAPAVDAQDLTATDDAAAAVAALRSAAAPDVDVEVAPTQVVGGTAIVPSQPAFDQLVGRLFGTPAPVRTLVLNGNGKPGIGEAVARAILPEGFRVVLSENAESFNHPKTTVTATGNAFVDDARRARNALGVGVVQVTRVPSGLADVTIVVGEDFKG